jgi:hypothetical protein
MKGCMKKGSEGAKAQSQLRRFYTGKRGQPWKELPPRCKELINDIDRLYAL